MIQSGLAIVAKRKEITLEVTAAHGEARLKARRVRNRYLTSPEPTLTSIDFAGAW